MEWEQGSLLWRWCIGGREMMAQNGSGEGVIVRIGVFSHTAF